MRVRWCSLCGHDVGAPVQGLNVDTTTLIMTTFVCLRLALQTWRKRVFILATKPGFDFAEEHLTLTLLLQSILVVFICVQWSSTYIATACQDRSRLMTRDEIHRLPRRVWQPQSKPQTVDWLQSGLTSLEQQQLKSMGNIVMPQLANLAAHVLSQI